jgi:hypothetical protein
MTTDRNIDYWGIISRSAGITWNHRFLWLFGFFAASGAGGGNSMNWKNHGVDEIRDFLMSHIGMMVAIIMGLVLLWFALFVLNLISKGALLSCISRADDGECIRFEEGWQAGIRAFWGMLGIAIIALIVFLVVTAVCVLAVVLPMIGGAAGIAIAVFIGAVLFIPYVVFLFLLAFTVIYAEREYVIVGGGVTDALSAGWNLTKTYFWQSLLMWLVSLVSSVAFIVGLLVVLLAIAMPFILIGIASPIAGLMLGIPIGLIVVVLAISAYSTYDHSLWTLMYRDLTRTTAATLPGGSPPAVEPPDPEPPAAEPPATGTPADRWDIPERRSDEEA